MGINGVITDKNITIVVINFTRWRNLDKLITGVPLKGMISTPRVILFLC